MRKLAALASTLFGLFVSIYLWWVYADPAHPMICMTGTGCDEVRASRFAQWFGVPTPAFGALMYSALFLLLFATPFVAPRFAKWMDRAAFAISAAGVAFSLFLSYLSEFVIHAWCSWCVMQACAVGATFFLLWTKWEPSEDAGVRLRSSACNSGLVLLGLAIGIPMFIHLSRAKEASYREALQPPVAAVPYERLVRPDSHVTGSSNPVLTIVEFGDFQCPSCIIGEPASEQIRQQYGDRVRFVFRQFPMPRLHEYAQKAAEAAECAGEQGRFWDAVQRFYAAEGDLSVPKLKQYAAGLGLDTGRFNACLDSGAASQRIAQDIADAMAAGVSSTPTFFLNGQRHLGPIGVQQVTELLGKLQPSESAQSSSVHAPAPAVTPTPTTLAAAAPRPRVSPTPDKKAGTSTFTPAGSTGSATLPLVGAGGGSGNPALLPGSASSSTGCDVNATAESTPAANEISTADAKKLHDTGAQFIDIRPKNDFTARHIPGAVSLPLTQVGTHARELPKDKTIVVYESGLSTGDVCGRSKAVAGILAGMGFANVKVYRDGLAGWEKQNLPVTK